MTEDKNVGPKVTEEPAAKEEVITGSGSVRKGADVLFAPPAKPIDDPTPMPLNMAPGVQSIPSSNDPSNSPPQDATVDQTDSPIGDQ